MKTILPDYSSIPLFCSEKHDGNFFRSSNVLEKFYIELAEEFTVETMQSESFAQAVWKHINRKNMKKYKFEIKTLLNGKTYDRIKQNILTNPSLNTVMAICIGLEIKGYAAEELLAKAGYKLNNSLIHHT